MTIHLVLKVNVVGSLELSQQYEAPHDRPHKVRTRKEAGTAAFVSQHLLPDWTTV